MRPSAGFSLVEVLVSIVILSLALLGTAGLTAASLKSTNTSFYRSQATVLADDYLDRMRANRLAARDGDYDVDSGLICHENVVTTLAYVDCTEWTNEIGNSLPGGNGIVSVGDDGVATITIEWDDATSSFTTESRL